MKHDPPRLAFALLLFGVGGLLCNWPLLSVAVDNGLWSAFRFLILAWGLILAGLFLFSRTGPARSDHVPDRSENGEGG